jgi:hypothetical protein
VAAHSLPAVLGLSAREALAAITFDRIGLVPLGTVARMGAVMDEAVLRAIVGDKAVGLANLLLAGQTVPLTRVIPIRTYPTPQQLAGLLPGPWAVRSSVAAGDDTAQPQPGLYPGEFNVGRSDLGGIIGRMKASVTSPQPLTTAADAGLKWLSCCSSSGTREFRVSGRVTA